MAKKMGRPVLEIDNLQFEKCLEINCTLEEVAGWFRCSEDTIERYAKKQYNKTFAEVLRLKRGVGRVSLRRKIWQNALAGDKALLIFLAKNELGMSDNRNIDTGGVAEVKLSVVRHEPNSNN